MEARVYEAYLSSWNDELLSLKESIRYYIMNGITGNVKRQRKKKIRSTFLILIDQINIKM